MRKLFALLSLLVVASMALAACGGAATQATAPATQPPAAPGGEEPMMEYKSKDPTTYFRPTFGDPETLDPALDYETAGGELVSNVYDTLVGYNRERADDFVPKLATEWTSSDDGTVYTFTIRQGVKFHEGGDLTPEDVAYSFQRGLLQGGYASPQWLLAEPFFGVGNDDISLIVAAIAVENITDTIVAGGDLASITGVDTAALEEALTEVDTTDKDAVMAAISDVVHAPSDDREALGAFDAATLVAACEQVKSAIVADDAAGTVTMALAQPWGPFLATIANNWGAIMDKEWVIENGGWDGSCDTWQNYYAMTAEENPFTPIANGTGPYKLDHWTRGQEYVLVRNDGYWGELPSIERVVVQTVNEFGTRFAMFQAGDADSLVVGSQADYAQVDPLVGEECLYNVETGNFDPCTPVGDGSGPIRVYKGMPQVSHTDVFLNFDITSNQYIGSGQLDGNGIPSDFFSDIHIRKAFNYCFDWDIFIQDVMVGEGVQTLTIPVAGMPGYDLNAPHYSYDPAKCEEEFKLADVDKDGIPAGDDPEGDVWTTGFRFAATYNQGNTTRQSVAEILASSLGSVNEKFLVEVLGLPWPAFLQSQRDRSLPVFISGWLEDIHDPHNWYQPYIVGTYGRRQSLPADLTSQFQDLLNQGVSETDPVKRAEIYAQVNQLYYDNAPGILLATATTRRYEQRWVNGYYYNPVQSGGVTGGLFSMYSKE